MERSSTQWRISADWLSLYCRPHLIGRRRPTMEAITILRARSKRYCIEDVPATTLRLPRESPVALENLCGAWVAVTLPSSRHRKKRESESIAHTAERCGSRNFCSGDTRQRTRVGAHLYPAFRRNEHREMGDWPIAYLTTLPGNPCRTLDGGRRCLPCSSPV